MRQLEEELRSEREAVARLGERERALAEEVVREKMAMQEMAELLKEARAHSNELPNGAVHEQQVAKLRDALADAKAEATATRVLLGQAKAERAGAEQRAAEASTAAQAAEQRASLAMREAAAARARETQQADPHRQAAQHSEQQWVAAQSALRQEIARLRQAAQQQQLNAARQVTEMQAEIRRLQGHSEAVLTWQAPLSPASPPASPAVAVGGTPPGPAAGTPEADAEVLRAQIAQMREQAEAQSHLWRQQFQVQRSRARADKERLRTVELELRQLQRCGSGGGGGGGGTLLGRSPSGATPRSFESRVDRAFDRVDALVGRSKGGAGGTFTQVPTLLVDEAS